MFCRVKLICHLVSMDGLCSLMQTINWSKGANHFSQIVNFRNKVLNENPNLKIRSYQLSEMGIIRYNSDHIILVHIMFLVYDSAKQINIF